jgi:hypothetical protein
VCGVLASHARSASTYIFAMSQAPHSHIVPDSACFNEVLLDSISISRLRKLPDILERLEDVCPQKEGVGWGRAASFHMMLAGLVMNTVTTLQKFIYPPTSSASIASCWTSRVVSWFELCQLVGLGAFALTKALPLAFKDHSAEAWCRAAEAADLIQSLSSMSVLQKIPRLKTAATSGPEQVMMEMKHYGNLASMSAGDVAMMICRSLAFSITEAGLGVLGVLALKLKMRDLGTTPSMPYWADFLSFANQMVGIHDVEAEKLLTLHRVILAGEDAEYQFHEMLSKSLLHGWLAQTLVEKHGWRRGWMIYCSFDSVDLQCLVVADGKDRRTKSEIPVASKSSCHASYCGVAESWWMAHPRCDMSLGGFLRHIEFAARLAFRSR